MILLYGMIVHELLMCITCKSRGIVGIERFYDSSFGFYEALQLIREKWGYKGIPTMEPNELKVGQLNEFISAMLSLKAN